MFIVRDDPAWAPRGQISRSSISGGATTANHAAERGKRRERGQTRVGKERRKCTQIAGLGK